MSVYIVAAPSIGLVKIGFASKPLMRFSALQSGCPIRLDLVAVIAGDLRCERALHGRFAALRRTGEWFALGDEIRDMIDRFPISRETRSCGHALMSRDGVLPFIRSLFDEINAFCVVHRMTATEFGERAMGDRAFMGTLCRGRDIRFSTSLRLRAFMRDWKPAADASEVAAA
jgi:hypothetical protein